MAWTAGAAEDLALEALGYLAADEDLIGAFLAGAGLRADDLRQQAGSPELALSVLDFILEEDSRVIGFARAAQIRPEAVMQARTTLAGPGSTGWAAD